MEFPLRYLIVINMSITHIIISRNIIRKYPSLLHLESFTKVRKFAKTCNYNFIQLIGLNSNIFKESIRARQNSCCLYFSHIVRRLARLQHCVKRLAKKLLYFTFLRPLLLTPSVFLGFFFSCKVKITPNFSR